MARTPSTRRSSVSRTRHALRPRLDPLEGRLLLAAGELDRTFGTPDLTARSGIATTPFDVSASEYAIGVAFQPDGKMIVSGTSTDFARLLELPRFNWLPGLEG